MSITGDVTFRPNKITFHNGRSLPLSLAGSVADFEDDLGRSVEATVYRVTTPANPLLENGRHLCCGGDYSLLPVTYVVAWIPGKAAGEKAPWAIAVFYGKKPPHSVTDPSYCGSYYYDSN